MRIGIIGAMLEEVSSIKEMMVISQQYEIGHRHYYEGTIGNTEVIVTFSRWGKVASASTTTTLINKFSVDFVLFTGVAGAVNDKLNIGDVVIGNGLYQHDMDARPFFDKYQVPLTSKIVWEPHENDVNRAKVAVEKFFSNDNFIKSDILIKYSIFSPKVHVGLIASGDKFVHNAKDNEDLKHKFNGQGTLAVEMEGAAVAQICEEHDIPYIVIRTISDKADHSANVDFKTFITDIAAIYSSKIVEEYIKLF